MKLRLLLSLLGLLAALGLSGCSREREDVVDQESVPFVSPYLNTQHSIALDVESGIGSGDLKAMGLKLEEGLRGVNFDITGLSPKIQSSTDNWKTYIFLRKKGDNANVGYVVYEYDQGERVSYQEGGVTKTKLILRPKDHNVTLQGVPAPPAAGEEWYISGITGGGTLDPVTMRMSFQNDYLYQPLTTMQVPFAFDWMPVTFEQRGATLMLVAKPMFKPLGTLIRVSVKNTLPSTEYFTMLSFDPANVPMSGAGYFDISASRYTDSQLASGATLHWEHASIPGIYEYKMHYEPQWAAGETKTFMFWGMPYPGTHKIGLAFSGYQSFLRTVNASTGKSGSIISERPIQSGKSYRLNIEVHRPKLPIEYVTERNLAGYQPLRWAETVEGSQSGYYNWAVTMGKAPGTGYDLFDGTANNPYNVNLMNESVDGVILNTKYRVPDLSDWMGIFPAVDMDFYHTGSPLTTTEVEHIKVGDHKLISQSEYLRVSPENSPDGYTIYAKRHQLQGSTPATFPSLLSMYGEAASNYARLTSNSLRCAYRYRIMSGSAWVAANPLRAGEVVIDVVYLGPQEDPVLSSIANDQWWNDRVDQMITRIFPANWEVGSTPGIPTEMSPAYTSTANDGPWGTTGNLGISRKRLLWVASDGLWATGEAMYVRLFTKD